MKAWAWGLRAQVSLLLDHGHPDAAEYPIGMLNDEASLVVERLGSEQATMGVVLQSALMTMPSLGMKDSAMRRAHETFGNLLARLTGKSHGE